MANDIFDVLSGAAAAYEMADDAINRPPDGVPGGKPQPTEALAHLERRINRLSLACQALWELLCERTDITEQQLADKVLEVDLRDGKTDGRMMPTAVKCPNCHKPTSSRRHTCIYCGVELQRRHPFEV